MRTGRAKVRRSLAYDLEHPENKRERQARYELTKAGRECHRRYYTSAKGRATGARYKRFVRECARRGVNPKARP